MAKAWKKFHVKIPLEYPSVCSLRDAHALGETTTKICCKGMVKQPVVEQAAEMQPMGREGQQNWETTDHRSVGSRTGHLWGKRVMPNRKLPHGQEPPGLGKLEPKGPPEPLYKGCNPSGACSEDPCSEAGVGHQHWALWWCFPDYKGWVMTVFSPSHVHEFVFCLFVFGFLIKCLGKIHYWGQNLKSDF